MLYLSVLYIYIYLNVFFTKHKVKLKIYLLDNVRKKAFELIWEKKIALSTLIKQNVVNENELVG